jgi:hypothetical protein
MYAVDIEIESSSITERADAAVSRSSSSYE